MIKQSLIFASFLSVFTCIGVAFYAFIRNYRNKAIVAWGILSLLVGLLSVGWGMILASNSVSQADFWLKICFTGGFFIPSAFISFVYAFLRRNNRLLIVISYIFSTFLYATYLFGYTVFIAFDPILGFYWWKAKFMYNFYLIHFFFCAGFGLYLLYGEISHSHGLTRNQIRLVFIASFLGFCGGATVFIPAYNISILPLGIYPFFVYPLVIAYAIAKYRLLDINIIFRKGMVYSLIISLFTGLYISFIFLFSQLFKNMAGGLYFFVIPILIIFFAIIFQPLKNHIQLQIDRLFFKDKYNYQKTLKELSQASTTILDLGTLLALVETNIIKHLKVKHASIYILKQDASTFKLK